MTQIYRNEAKSNEIWADADGCLYTPHPYGGWLAFGSPSPIVEGENEFLTLPMTRIFDENGKRVYDGDLPYPKLGETS